MIVAIKKLDERAIVPQYAHGSMDDAGVDLHALEGLSLRANVPTLVRTGLAIDIPRGYEGQVRSRSGLALKYGVQVYNAPGTIDPSYRGEVGVILLWNGFKGEACGGRFEILAGDRIAQLVFAEYTAASFVEVAELSSSNRGQGGFGSTGVDQHE